MNNFDDLEDEEVKLMVKEMVVDLSGDMGGSEVDLLQKLPQVDGRVVNEIANINNYLNVFINLLYELRNKKNNII